MKIEAIKHKDVRGNELYYLKITNKHKEDHLVNIGVKTFNSVKELEDNDKLNDEQFKKQQEERTKQKKLDLDNK